ncbi:PKD domain-containing protein [Gelidibacter salicanalis]|uniref:PQQ-dependent sugar dehydrogenase n=1 Tax=Gelidibacter salicanalis TaxID=291193 RepID=A0A934KUC9_9FLAO|nr:malectin domain-containing carbohydrate-binding protein [Gelidibacter salicanalis]MBJ7879595.1 PQQ-dependent sugar dehydrogenase [Gelidibacter salicanalis]
MKNKLKLRPEFLFAVFRNLNKNMSSISRGAILGVFLILFSVYHGNAQLPTDFQKVELLTGLANATTMKFAPDGRIFIVDRYGELLIYKPDTQSTVSAGVLPVFHGFEDGFLGLAFDPEFTVNQKIYVYYSLPSVSKNRISQFSMNGDALELSTEVSMLEWDVQRINSYHAGGDMAFDSQGNLYIAIGDNTNHGLYGALDENNPNNSAEKSSSHTNDYRGKILRIKPNASNGSYTIPAGNLFPPGTPLTRPEIYVMGTRNPYRIFVDKENTDWLFWAEVGPDANTPGIMGPEGLDEINLTKTAGNYGWPYFSGVDNDPYQIPYKSPSPFYNDPAAPENTSVWNKAPYTIGATVLPPVEPAWLEFFHKSYFAGPRYYYDGAATDQQRLPAEFDGVFFYYDFNTSKIWAVKLDTTGNILSNEQLAPSVFPSSKNGFIDMKIGPDGHIYILEYGTGCCPQNAGTGKLVRVDYTGIITNLPPTVVINADVTSGSLPLTVNFTSAGTTDPNGDTPLTYAWDFQNDGTVDATTENAAFTFTSAGTYSVQLRVNDGKGAVGVKNVTIHAGNNAATFSFNSPLDGGFVGWGDDITIDLMVIDQEDGSTGSGIDCADVSVVPSLGHLNHFHDGATINGCSRTLTLQYEGHDIDGGADLFYVLGTNYTDQGGLQAFDQIQLHPKRKEAEYYDTQSGVETISNTDPLLGGEEAIRVDNNSHISFSGRNLFNINSVRYRVASIVTGGTIEFRTGSSTGPILATAVVPATGSLNTWINIDTPFTDPGGKHDLFFVFKNSSSSQDIFDVNYVEFTGAGVSVDNSPPLINEVKSLSTTEIHIEFSEYMNQASAETLSNYTINNGITVSGASLLGDGRSVLLNVSQMSSNTTYNLTVSNAQNLTGLPVSTGNYPLSMIGTIRINAGGPLVSQGPDSFEADQYFTGGSLYNAVIPIAETTDDALYQTERYGAFTYEVPVPVAGAYDIRLHFAELYFGVGRSGGPGSRVFNVSIEGVPVLTDFDILNETAPATALKKEFDNISITDGFATIQFSKVVENPKLSGIEILPPSTFEPVPNIYITFPANNSTVSQPFQVDFSVENWTIQEGGTHMHYSIDGQIIGPHYNYDPINIEGLSSGSHIIRLELYDVGHIPTGIFNEITVNVEDQGVCNSTPFPNSWAVHQLETNPYTAVYTIPDFDLDGDGLKDIVTGGWWYKNPGSASGNWIKNTIGGGFGNVVHVYDFDGDGFLDLLGTTLGSGSGNEYKSAQLLWAKNDGSGSFTVYTNIPAGTTNYSEPFLAGIAGGNFGLGNPYQMAINWNGAESTGSPVQLLTPTANPTTGTWTLVNISNNSSGEDIKAGDIDGDGDLDLFQGINWLRNEGNGNWTTFSTGVTYVTTPDRVQLADFNGDGRLDAIVGQLGLGSNPNRSEFAWFEAPEDPTQPWIRHILSTSVTGSLSVFAIDIDFDGDMDIVVGEWLGSRRLLVFENDLCNTGTWTTHILNDGALDQEHHDGAMVTDIDNDGDLDVISNGWLKHKVPRIYENTTLSNGSQIPIANAGPDQTITLPSTTSATFNGTGTDPDGGAITAYQWTQQSGPNAATLSGDSTADLTVGGLAAGNYVFRLTVTDDQNETSTDEVMLVVQTAAGAAPIVEAGADQTITLPTNTIILNGTGSDPDGGAVSFLWTKQSGPSAALSGTTTPALSASNLVEGSYVFRLTVTDPENDTAFDEVTVTVLPEATGGFALRINSGGPQITLGTTNFGADQYASGGKLYNISSPIAGTDGDVLYQTERFGTVTYQIPVPKSGEYDVRLHFAELYFGVGSQSGGLGSRVFNVSIEGLPVLTNFDILSEVLPATAIQKTFDGVIVTDGFVTIQFSKVVENPKISGIEVLGSGSSSAPPVANAGADQTIALPINTTTFNGTGTDPDGGAIIAYQWTQQSGPNTATLSGDSTADLTAGGLAAGNYVFRLAVTDDQNETGTDEVMLVVQTAAGAAPIVEAGADQTITLPGTASATFNGTGTDPDGGAITTYQWTQQRGPNVATLSGDSTADLTVDGLVEGTYVFRLAVTDDQNETGTDQVTLVVQTAAGTAPIVEAGADRTINLPTNNIILNGTGSDPDGGAVSFLWTQQSGPSATLSGTTTPALSASNLVEGSYVFRLTVTDPENNTAFDEVTVTVLPEAVEGFALRINSGGPQITLGTTSFGADQYASGGKRYNTSSPIAGTDGDALYQTERFGVVTYQIPVPNSGEYNVRLHFAELYFGVGSQSGGPGSRVFNVTIEGNPVLTNFDILSEVLPATAIQKTFDGVIVTDGFVTIQFSKVVENPKISGIEVLGSGSSSAPPVANAGADQTIALPINSTTFNGTGTDPDGGTIIAYQWTQQSGPNTATLSGDSTADLTVGGLAAGTYVFRLTVIDDQNETGTDEVTLVVQTAAGTAPIVEAGADQTITLPINSTIFNGTGTDPDGGAITAYQWTQQSGPNTATLSGDSTADLTVGGLAAGTYVFRLAVTDDQNETGTDEAMLVVQMAAGAAPIANAGPDQTITLPTNNITLNGTGSDPDGGAVSFLWTKQSGPGAALSGTATPTLSASNLVEGSYVFRLTVTDPENDTAFDEVTVTVLPEAAGGFALRINTGGPGTTYNGTIFEADQYFDVGKTLDRPQTGMAQPYRTIRYSPSMLMAYNIPVPSGEYTVILHFAEIYFGATGGGSGGVGSRVFDVSLEGQLVEDNLDVFAQAGGPQSMLIKSHTVTVTDGVLDIDFSSLANVGGVRHPIINAIEVLGTVMNNKQGVAVKGTADNFTDSVASESSDDGPFSEINNITRITPNPASYEVQVTLSDVSLNIIHFNIHDLGGRLVKRTNSGNSQLSPGHYRFDISNLENAIYIINITTSDGNNSRHKLIINK